MAGIYAWTHASWNVGRGARATMRDALRRQGRDPSPWGTADASAVLGHSQGKKPYRICQIASVRSLAIVQPDSSQTRPRPILVHPRAPRGELLPALPERKPIFGNEAGSRTATPLARSLLLAKYHVSCPYWGGVVIRGVHRGPCESRPSRTGRPARTASAPCRSGSEDWLPK